MCLAQSQLKMFNLAISHSKKKAMIVLVCVIVDLAWVKQLLNISYDLFKVKL